MLPAGLDILGRPKGQDNLAQRRAYPVSAKIIVRRFDGRMAFVPEGQDDRSQARSAWVIDAESPRPGGTVEVWWPRPPTQPSLASHLSRDRFNGSIVPLGRDYFTRDSRHFVPGYYRAVPPGQKPFAHRSATQLS